MNEASLIEPTEKVFQGTHASTADTDSDATPVCSCDEDDARILRKKTTRPSDDEFDRDPDVSTIQQDGVLTGIVSIETYDEDDDDSTFGVLGLYAEGQAGVVI